MLVQNVKLIIEQDKQPVYIGGCLFTPAGYTIDTAGNMYYCGGGCVVDIPQTSIDTTSHS